MSLMCGCDGNYNEFESHIFRRARIIHKCGECGKGIAIGETYEYIAQKSDGDFFTHKACEACSDLAASMIDMGFCWVYGDLAEMHSEYIAEYQPPKLSMEQTE